MNEPASRRLHTYLMSDTDVRDAIAALLRHADGLTVTTSGPHPSLSVSCRTRNEARCVHRLVTLTDPGATLINQTYTLAMRNEPALEEIR